MNKVKLELKFKTKKHYTSCRKHLWRIPKFTRLFNILPSNYIHSTNASVSTNDTERRETMQATMILNHTTHTESIVKFRHQLKSVTCTSMNSKTYTYNSFPYHHSGSSQWINSLRKHRAPIHKVTAPGSAEHWCDLGHAAVSSAEENWAMEQLTSSASLSNTGEWCKKMHCFCWTMIDRATKPRLYISWTFNYVYMVYCC